MERRRRHLECRPGEGGCYVVLGDSCRRKEVVMGWMMSRGVRDEVLVYGLLFVFWTVVWQVVKISVLGRHSAILSAPFKLHS